MPNLVLQPTSTAQWHALVSEAEYAADVVLGEELESYLVFLLMRFTANPQMLSSVIALDYLNNIDDKGRNRDEKLRDVADQCLLFCGLFPRQAERRMVKVSYFVQLGRSAYQQLAGPSSKDDYDLFSSLADHFVVLMDILQTMRALQSKSRRPSMSLLHAFELWHETGSQNAYKIIRSCTNAHPIRVELSQAEQAAMDSNIH